MGGIDSPGTDFWRRYAIINAYLLFLFNIRSYTKQFLNFKTHVSNCLL